MCGTVFDSFTLVINELVCDRCIIPLIRDRGIVVADLSDLLNFEDRNTRAESNLRVVKLEVNVLIGRPDPVVVPQKGVHILRVTNFGGSHIRTRGKLRWLIFCRSRKMDHVICIHIMFHSLPGLTNIRSNDPVYDLVGRCVDQIALCAGPAGKHFCYAKGCSAHDLHGLTLSPAQPIDRTAPI